MAHLDAAIRADGAPDPRATEALDRSAHSPAEALTEPASRRAFQHEVGTLEADITPATTPRDVPGGDGTYTGGVCQARPGDAGSGW